MTSTGSALVAQGLYLFVFLYDLIPADSNFLAFAFSGRQVAADDSRLEMQLRVIYRFVCSAGKTAVGFVRLALRPLRADPQRFVALQRVIRHESKLPR